MKCHYNDEPIKQRIRQILAGENLLDGSTGDGGTQEEALFRLVQHIDADAYRCGRMEVQCAITDAIGLKDWFLGR